MTSFVAPPLKGLFETSPIAVWVSQKSAGHVALTYQIDTKNGHALGASEDRSGSLAEASSNSFDLEFLDDNRVQNGPIDWTVTNKQRLVSTVELDEFSKVSFPVYLHNVVAKAELKFGIDWLGNIGSIKPDGTYCPPKNRPGFTCATYLCEVFRSHGLQVVDEKTWPTDTIEIFEWFKSILARFLRQEGREATISSIESTRPLKRLTPAEFAGAASSGSKSWPMCEAQARQLAMQIKQDFESKFPR